MEGVRNSVHVLPRVPHPSDPLSLFRSDAFRNLFRGMVHSYVNDTPEKYRWGFDQLLGIVVEGVQYYDFMASPISVSCVPIYHKDMDKLREGKIIFQSVIPAIGKPLTQAPRRARFLNMAKTLDYTDLGVAFFLTRDCIELLLRARDGTDPIPSFMHDLRVAMNSLRTNVQLAIDGMQRGMIEQACMILMQKALPHFLITPLMKYNRAGTGNVTDLAALYVDLARTVPAGLFFLDKVGVSPVNVLLEMTTHVGRCALDVNGLFNSHTTAGGVPIEGVMVGSTSVVEALQELLPAVDASANFPANMIIFQLEGDNLVNALVFGQAINNFESFARAVLGGSDSYSGGGGGDGSTRMRVPMKTVRVGSKTLALDTVDAMFEEARQPSPFYTRVRYMSCTLLGGYRPPTEQSRLLEGGRPPVSIFLRDASGAVLEARLAQYCSFFCNPNIHDLRPFLEAGEAWMRRAAGPGSFEHNDEGGVSAYEPGRGLRHNYARWLDKQGNFVTSLARKSGMTRARFLAPDNPLLPLELHPFYDFWVHTDDNGLRPVGVGANSRYCTGNIPFPLTDPSFLLARGAYDECPGASSLSDETQAAVEATVRNNPLLVTLIEGLVHGDSCLFELMRDLIVDVCVGVHARTGGVAFLGNFPMMLFVYKRLCQGVLPAHVAKLYREIMSFVEDLTRLVDAHVICGAHDPARDYWLHLLNDVRVLPPLLYSTDYKRTQRRKDATPKSKVVFDGDPRAAPALVQTEERPRDPFVLPAVSLLHENDPARVALDARDQRMERAYYFAFLAGATNGVMCTAGLKPVRAYLELLQDPSWADAPPAYGQVVRRLFEECALPEDHVRCLRLFCRNPVQPTVAHCTFEVHTGRKNDDGHRVTTGAVVNGVLLLGSNLSPFHSHFLDPMPAGCLFASPEILMSGFPDLFADRARRRNLGRLDWMVPGWFGLEQYQPVRTPFKAFLQRVPAATVRDKARALVHMGWKVNPYALFHLLQTGGHPGVALTLVRNELLEAETLIYGGKGGELLFMSPPSAEETDQGDRRDFLMQHRMAHVDAGTGFTGSQSICRVHRILSTRGTRPFNFCNVYRRPEWCDELRDYMEEHMVRRDPNVSEYVGALRRPNPAPQYRDPVGLLGGQTAPCFPLPTPVNVDLEYFMRPNNPRGRSGPSVGLCPGAEMEGLLTDHGLSDPAYPDSATHNPWCSQRGSLGDVLYNPKTRCLSHGAEDVPVSRLFDLDQMKVDTDEVSGTLKHYLTLVQSAAENHSYSFRNVLGIEKLLTAPSEFFWRSYPTLSSSCRDMLFKFTSSVERSTFVEASYGCNYLVQENSPLTGTRFA